jgi:precorrin-2 dehydrogenase / sirohydrochlorin ferrochelatase
MKSLYPIHLHLKGRKVTVIGGGKIAERKIRGLLETGALVEIISPDITLTIQELIKSYPIEWKQKSYSDEDVSDAFMIIAATNDRSVNLSIARAYQNKLVNIADDPEASNFLIPSVVKRGKLVISVSTGGASPILSTRIRAKLEEDFDERYEKYLDFLHMKRQFILKNVDDLVKRKLLLLSIVDNKFLQSENREEDFLGLYNNIMSTNDVKPNF